MAYRAVPVAQRDRALSASTITKQQPVGERQQAQSKWPDSLKKWVGRAFARCKDSNWSQVEKAMKQIITDAFERDEVWDIDWDTMPLDVPYISKPQSLLPSPPPPPPNNNKRRKQNSNKKVSNVDPTPPETAFELAQKAKRAQRFSRTTNNNNNKMRSSSSSFLPLEDTTFADDVNFDQYVIVGRSTQLEKRYLRLTSAPDPESVRPLPILRKTLDLLKQKWKAESNYPYICDQFKSLRQDLTVQRITNDFTVTVYEIHARIALEKGDLGEYNQCQGQLRRLYQVGFSGNQLEFLAYRILYLMYTKNRSDINEMMATLSPDQKVHPAVAHALEVRSAIATLNYHRFFKLYIEAPNMGGYLMDKFIDRERAGALCTLCKAYRPMLDMRFITEELGFEGDSECISFLQQHGVDLIMRDNRLNFDTKAALDLFEPIRASLTRVDIKGQL